MSNDTEYRPDAIIDLDAAAEVARTLEPVVRDLVALAVDGKQAHWHVRGMNFLPLHEFLDVFVDHARAASDELAERIVALGRPVDARIGQVAAHTRTPQLDEGFLNADVMIRQVIAQIDATRQDMDAAIRALADVDEVSQDLVIAAAQQLDQDRWFLAAHLDNA